MSSKRLQKGGYHKDSFESFGFESVLKGMGRSEALLSGKPLLFLLNRRKRLNQATMYLWNADMVSSLGCNMLDCQRRTNELTYGFRRFYSLQD